ncbi:transporter substrate-binding domain-containing protein [Cupriavidus sp. TMH.W2]|uniref:transporter substrate-binding domain-containing protein n=1 Tax=Cupriavidus sp. TMH.W2 TaxID=3434465 RepID=UPI003D775DF6
MNGLFAGTVMRRGVCEPILTSCGILGGAMVLLASQQLAPQGVLRAGVNLANTLLVSGVRATGEPWGVAPDLAHWIAEQLSVPCVCVPFASPSDLLAAADDDVWDICLIGVDSRRSNTISFTGPYAETEATYLVRRDSGVRRISEVDRPGVRIAAADGSAYALWLSRHLTHGILVPRKSHESAHQAFMIGEADALAGLRPNLSRSMLMLPDSRVLDGGFLAIQQAVGTRKQNYAGIEFLRTTIHEACSRGVVADAIAKHRIGGLRVVSAMAD